MMILAEAFTVIKAVLPVILIFFAQCPNGWPL
jgi:hypothetical protein